MNVLIWVLCISAAYIISGGVNAAGVFFAISAAVYPHDADGAALFSGLLSGLFTCVVYGLAFWAARKFTSIRAEKKAQQKTSAPEARSDRRCFFPWAFAVIVVCLTGMLAVQHIRHTSEVSELTAQIDKLEDELDSIRLENYLISQELSTLQYDLDFYGMHIVFVPADGSTVYHKLDCPYYTADSFLAYNSKNAQYLGYVPCSVCCPDDLE